MSASLESSLSSPSLSLVLPAAGSAPSGSAGSAERTDVLARYGPLAAPDGTFNRIAAMAAAIFCTPIATVSIVDQDRVRLAAAYGLDGVTELNADPGLCATAVLTGGTYVVNDARSDPRTMRHPLVRGALGLRFYAAAPIMVEGHALGTVNVIDRKRRRVSPAQLELLSELAATAAQILQLTLVAHSAASERATQVNSARAAASQRAVQYLTGVGHLGATTDRPSLCELGGSAGCSSAAELKVADSWGDSAWGCWEHAEDALLQVPSVFLAQTSSTSLQQYRQRCTIARH